MNTANKTLKILILVLLAACKQAPRSPSDGNDFLAPIDPVAPVEVLSFYSGSWSCTRSSTIGFTEQITAIEFYDVDDVTVALRVNGRELAGEWISSRYMATSDGNQIEDVTSQPEGKISFRWNEFNARSNWLCTEVGG